MATASYAVISSTKPRDTRKTFLCKPIGGMRYISLDISHRELSPRALRVSIGLYNSREALSMLSVRALDALDTRTLMALIALSESSTPWLEA